jgi:hypothetical protein
VRGKGEGKGKGGVMTQSLYAHMNKGKKKRNTLLIHKLLKWITVYMLCNGRLWKKDQE